MSKYENLMIDYGRKTYLLRTPVFPKLNVYAHFKFKSSIEEITHCTSIWLCAIKTLNKLSLQPYFQVLNCRV